MSGIVAVIDYGMGNLHSVASALEHVGADEVLVTHDADLIRQADRVVFPGVGAIRDCMAEIRRLKCDELLQQALTERNITHLVLTGVTTQCCVHSTLRDAVERGYFCLTLDDCCAAEEADVHKATLRIIEAENNLFGWIAQAEAFIEAIQNKVIEIRAKPVV